jgi:hypothetical protein
MRVSGRTALVAAAVILSAACGGGGSKAPEQKADGAGAAATTAATTSVAAGDFGVPECDEYMRKYLECVNSKVPESARAMVKQSLDATRSQWKQAASTPQGKAGLAMACTQATTAAKQAMSAYGCTW